MENYFSYKSLCVGYVFANRSIKFITRDSFPCVSHVCVGTQIWPIAEVTKTLLTCALIGYKNQFGVEMVLWVVRYRASLATVSGPIPCTFCELHKCPHFLIPMMMAFRFCWALCHTNNWVTCIWSSSQY
jgi:hypothetical protein